MQLGDELYHIDEQIRRKSFLVFCNLLLYVHHLNSFPYPSVSFLRHIHLVLRFAFIIY